VRDLFWVVGNWTLNNWICVILTKPVYGRNLTQGVMIIFLCCAGRISARWWEAASSARLDETANLQNSLPLKPASKNKGSIWFHNRKL